MRWIIVIALVLLLAAGLGYYYRAEMREGGGAGAAFAGSHAQGQCVEESFAQLPNRGGMAGRAYVLSFARACLQRAAADEKFCAEIPDNLLSAVQWISDRCAGHGSDAKLCQKIYQYAASACTGSLPGMSSNAARK